MTKRRSDNATTRRPARRLSATVRGRGFTLIEALVAVAMLLIIILFVARIFGSASDVAASGQANADVMQEIAAFEQQIRDDFQRLSYDGYIAILSTAVRNGINDPSGTNPDLWLDPNRDVDAYIRSDRIVFFTQGMSTIQVFRAANGINDNRKAQTTENRVYYGHGFQVGGDPDGNALTFDDVDPAFQDVPPWFRDVVDYTTGSFTLIQPGALQWTVARQNVLLSDDGLGGPDSFASSQASSTDSIWSNELRNSRVDAAASQLNDIRRQVYVEDPAGPVYRDWSEMVDEMFAAVFYPRAERVSASMLRQDHATTVSTLGSAVSDFTIEWTYGTGSTGLVADPFDPNDPFAGVSIPWAGVTPWFGLPDSAIFANSSSTPARGVFMLADEDSWDVDDEGPVFPDQFEFLDTSDPDELRYAVVFGYNRARPLNDQPTSADYNTPWDTEIGSDGVEAYTPWPRALRFTLRVHDVNSTFQSGREVQFVVDLPQRR